MITEMNLMFSQILEKAYVKWRERQRVGENKSEAEFARWLGYSPTTFNTWKLKNPPSDDAAIGNLARKFKELDRKLVTELYESLGIDDPWEIETKNLIEKFSGDRAFRRAAQKLYDLAAELDEKLRRK